jgi:hypothetical protein
VVYLVFLSKFRSHLLPHFIHPSVLLYALELVDITSFLHSFLLSTLKKSFVECHTRPLEIVISAWKCFPFFISDVILFAHLTSPVRDYLLHNSV